MLSTRRLVCHMGCCMFSCIGFCIFASSDSNVQFPGVLLYHSNDTRVNLHAAFLANSTATKAIFIVALIPQSNLATVSAFGLALKRIEADQLLPHDFTVKIVLAMTGCHPDWAMRDLFNLLHSLPRAFALLGCGCPELTGPISQMSHFWNITMVSYEDTSPELGDMRRYRNLIRLAPSEADANLPRLRLLRLFNWTKTCSIYQDSAADGSHMAAASAGLSDLLESNGFDMTGVTSARYSTLDSATAALQLMKAKQNRVISAFTSQLNRLSILFCAAYNTGTFGSRHVWMVSGLRLQVKSSSPHQLHLTCAGSGDDGGCNCTDAQLLKALNGSFFIDLVSFHSGDFGLGTPVSSRFRAAYAFDSVLAVGKAAGQILRVTNSLSSLDSQTLMLTMMGLNFSGVTGMVRFSKNSRLGILSLQQILVTMEGNSSSFHFLSEFDSSSGVFTDEARLFREISWPGGKPPRDKTVVETRLFHLQLWLFCLFAGLSTAGIGLSLVLMSVNIKYRNHPFIKMSSPQMNNLIVLGCILCYAAVTLLAIDGPTLSADAATSSRLLPKVCATRAWVMSVGFTLSFGAMFSKTWRVHYIFTDISMGRKMIKDYHLMMVVFFLLLIDIAILTTWTLIDPMWSNKQLISVDLLSDDREIHWYNEVCVSNNLTLWLGLLFAYKGLLMVIGCFFAWETRSVSIPALNDSKYIGMSVYNALVMCVSGAAVSFALKDTNQTASFVITSMLTLCCTSITLGLVFLPKLLEIRRDPKGEERRARATLLRGTVRRQVRHPRSGDGGGGLSGDVEGRRAHRSAEHRRPPDGCLPTQVTAVSAAAGASSAAGSLLARALEENWQLQLRLHSLTSEVEKLTQTERSKPTEPERDDKATDISCRLMLLDFIDGVGDTSQQWVWIPRSDIPRPQLRQRFESETDSFDQYIADVQERLLCSEARLASPDPSSNSETVTADCLPRMTD